MKIMSICSAKLKNVFSPLFVLSNKEKYHMTMNKDAKTAATRFNMAEEDFDVDGNINLSDVLDLHEQQIPAPPPALNYSLPVGSNFGIVDDTPKEKPRFNGEFRKVRHDFTGFSAMEVFLPENQLYPEKAISAGKREGYLNLPCNNKFQMQQLGRAIAQYIYGCWSLNVEHDNEETPPHHWVIDRYVNGMWRAIRARLTQTTIDGQVRNKAVTEEWSCKDHEWFNHSIQGSVTSNSMAYQKQRGNHDWLVCLSKYHYLGLLLSVDADRPIGGDLTVKKGISLVGDYGQAVKWMQWGYRSEMWQLSGFSYNSLKSAARGYGHLTIQPNMDAFNG